MSRPPPKAGVYISVYLSPALYEHYEQEARRKGLSMSGTLRDALIESCPQDVQIEARAALGRASLPPKNGVKGVPT